MPRSRMAMKQTKKAAAPKPMKAMKAKKQTKKQTKEVIFCFFDSGYETEPESASNRFVFVKLRRNY